MNEHPEALRLADALTNRHGVESFEGDAAKELRRLHHDFEAAKDVGIAQEKELIRLEDQNHALLEALKRIKETGVFLGAIAQEMMDSAIKKAEGTE
jgi:hypothetical protein